MSTNDTSKKLYTMGSVAATLGEPIHRVEYVVRTRGIEGYGLAGSQRIFGTEHVEQVAAGLREVDATKAKGGRRGHNDPPKTPKSVTSA